MANNKMKCEHPRKDRAVIQNPGIIFDGKTVVCGACKQELYEYNARYYLGKAVKWFFIACIIVFLAYIIGRVS